MKHQDLVERSVKSFCQSVLDAKSVSIENETEFLFVQKFIDSYGTHTNKADVMAILKKAIRKYILKLDPADRKKYSCYKVPYETAEIAAIELEKTRKKYKYAHDSIGPADFYRCPNCGKFHFASKYRKTKKV